MSISFTLSVSDPNTAGLSFQAWYQYFQAHDPKQLFELMDSHRKIKLDVHCKGESTRVDVEYYKEIDETTNYSHNNWRR